MDSIERLALFINFIEIHKIRERIFWGLLFFLKAYKICRHGSNKIKQILDKHSKFGNLVRTSGHANHWKGFCLLWDNFEILSFPLYTGSIFFFYLLDEISAKHLSITERARRALRIVSLKFY